jgi:hypothetical protein
MKIHSLAQGDIRTGVICIGEDSPSGLSSGSRISVRPGHLRRSMGT